MPMYDLVCKNNHEQYNLLLKIGERPPCPLCSEPTETLWKSSNAVLSDSIPGGVEIRHGICNEDGTPRRYYSRSEMEKEAKRRGLTNLVEHIPEKGSDKSKHTTKWV